MATLNRFSPAASFGDKFFGMSAKERVVGVPANSLSGGFTVPDRERAGTKQFYLGDDGGLPQATQTVQISATTPLLAPEGSPLTTNVSEVTGHRAEPMSINHAQSLVPHASTDLTPTPADNKTITTTVKEKPKYFMYLGIAAAALFLLAPRAKR